MIMNKLLLTLLLRINSWRVWHSPIRQPVQGTKQSSKKEHLTL